MLRMVKPLLLVLLLGSSCLAKDAKVSKDSKACEAQVAQVTKLKAQLEAAEAEIAALKKQSSAVEEVPYVSTKLIVDSLGHVTGALGQGSFSVDLKPVYTAADASYDVFQKASTQATEIASQGSAAAKTAISTAAEMAQDMHGKHVSQHTREYHDYAMKTYSTHLEPHVTMARKVYDDNAVRYVDMATAGISAGVGAAREATKSASPKLQELWTQGTNSLLGASGGALGDKLALLTQPRSVSVLGRTRTFRHGIMDICLAVVQGACVFYVAFQLLWKLFLKTLVWNIGMKFFGKKVCINLTAMLVKVSFRLTQIILRILYTLVFTVLSLVLTCLVLPIAVGGGLGVGLLHGIEKNFAVGLSTGQRLGLGVAVGTLMWFLVWLQVRYCCRRSSKAANHKNGGKPASGKSAPAKATTATKLDAKARAEATTKGTGKKK